MLDREVQINARQVLHERLDGEVVAINMATGSYFSLSGSAADVWTLVDMGVKSDSWSDILGRAFLEPVDVSDLSSFIQDCLEAQLLVEGAPAVCDSELFELPSDYRRGAWAIPRLEEFEDLQDLILVDPIHDTAALGWPHIDAS